MTAPRTLLSLAEDYLAERRGLGFRGIGSGMIRDGALLNGES